MPPACPVESHVGSYIGAPYDFQDATGLPGGVSRWQLHRRPYDFQDATGLPGGVSRWQLPKARSLSKWHQQAVAFKSFT